MTSPPSVILVAGKASTYCGVEDYTAQLSQWLHRRGLSATQERLQGTCGSFRRSYRFLKRTPAVLHFQYPCLGFGRSLYPQLLLSVLALSHRIVTTIHEFRNAHLLRKLSLAPFAILSKALIFTTPHELRAAALFYPWIVSRSVVIPIGSNIPSGHGGPRDMEFVVYFGLIEAGKGLELFTEFVRHVLIRRPSFRFAVIGTPTQRGRTFYNSMRASTSHLPISWHSNQAPEAVADHLRRAGWAYLPFPDGASERRASLLAALINGVTVLTTEGRDTPEQLKASCGMAASPVEAAEILLRLAGAPSITSQMKRSAELFVQKHRWEDIARAHASLYASLHTP